MDENVALGDMPSNFKRIRSMVICPVAEETNDGKSSIVTVGLFKLTVCCFGVDLTVPIRGFCRRLDRKSVV